VEEWSGNKNFVYQVVT